MDKIQKEGLDKMSRHHVHLSDTYATVKNVGSRHGKPVVPEIDAQKMHEEGFLFYLSEDGV